MTQLSPVLSGENISLGERSFLLSPFWANARDYTLYHPIKTKCCSRIFSSNTRLDLIGWKLWCRFPTWLKFWEPSVQRGPHSMNLRLSGHLTTDIPKSRHKCWFLWLIKNEDLIIFNYLSLTMTQITFYLGPSHSAISTWQYPGLQNVLSPFSI